MNTLYRGYVQLAPDEWFNHEAGCIMDRIAKEYLENHKDKFTDTSAVLVQVYEHGGWSVQFTLISDELVIVGSANHLAVFPAKVHQWWDKFRSYNVEYLESIRRGE